MTTWQLRDPRMAEAIQVAREYLGPEAEHWPDDEVVHQLTIKAIDLERQLIDLRPKEPAREAPQWRYGSTRDTDAR